MLEELETLTCDSLCAERVGHTTAAAGIGHSSLNTAAVYLRSNDRDIKELYDKTPF